MRKTLLVQTTDGDHHVHVLPEDATIEDADKVCETIDHNNFRAHVYVVRALLFSGTHYPELVRPRFRPCPPERNTT